MRQIKKIHLIGIGGSGMGGIAEVLHHLNYKVSGSDVTNNAMVMHLRYLGIDVQVGHNAVNVEQKDVVVVSSAIATNNVELEAAKELKIPVVQRAQMLAELMRFKHGIAVAGAHGKTTTTSLIANIIAASGHDPTFVIGGRVHGFNSNARLGKGSYFIVEADESDASFLQLNPLVSVITNIDHDHLENYSGDFAALQKAYISFVHKLPFYGLLVICSDDSEIMKISDSFARPMVSYGFNEPADYKIKTFKRTNGKSTFTVQRKNNIDLQVTMQLPGKHNVLNATAAIAVATEEGISDQAIMNGIESFTGVERRMQNLGEINLDGDNGKVLLIDDYGHHPTEITAVIVSLREDFPDRRLVMLFQPHRYSRTSHLFQEFINALATVDFLVLLEVYPAGEDPIIGADSAALSAAIASNSGVKPVVIKALDTVHKNLQAILQDGDLLVTQGAGNIGKLAQELACDRMEA